MSIQCLTVKVKPYEGESLFSLAIRAAKANGLTVCELLNMNRSWSKHYFQSNEFHCIDFIPTSLDLDSFEKTLSINKEELVSHTFNNLLSTFSHNSKLGSSRFISGMIRNGLFFCPQCLAQRPFLKLIWRLECTDFCTDHKVILQKTCDKCQEVILYEEMVCPTSCPYCGFELQNSRLRIASKQDMQKKYFYIACWEALLSHNNNPLTPSEIAFKLLYLLNSDEQRFDKQYVSDQLMKITNVSSILQQARGTLSQKRTIHLRTIFEILKLTQTSINQFLTLVVPKSFSNSIIQPHKKILTKLSCQAPCCDEYRLKKNLKKTPTSLKRKKNGEILLYYTICPGCGCQYALDKAGKIQERSYFIKGYRL